MLMWAYYADGHQGICYRFKLIPRNLKNIPPDSLLFLKMDYDNNFPKTNFYKDSTEDFVREIFGTKAKCWEHEKEWRFITISKVGKVQCPILRLDAIIFGLKTNRKGYKELIRDWIGNKGETIELLQVKNKRRSFELEIIPEPGAQD
nr:DUF2971 domain-containing protein [Desulfobacula sp.]